MSLLTRAMPLSRSIAHQAILRSCLGRSTPAVTAPAAGALTVSKRGSATGNFTPVWTMEKAVSASLLGVVPLALAVPSPATEFALALTLTAHIHWGVEAIVVDYIRARLFGEFVPKFAVGMVYALSFATLGGLMYFNFTDVGLAHAIRMLWKL